MSVRVSLPWVLASMFRLQAGRVLLAALDLPLAVSTLSLFFGPILGPLVGCFINWNLVPETYTPVLPKWTATRLPASTHDEMFDAPLDGKGSILRKVVGVSCYKPFQRMTYDRMALNAWNALLLGILYLAFQASQFIFAEHGFSAY
ncbi:hypothetical protein FIBSPDRAFT_948835 [Athelia psychrophila]|uniref:Uncharacterized protein n=1 Tax=Athelia psychrophila TaxID=1759441 RepID=A0A166QJ70_9AGAM|nr:hypothetical protein FIBSPDRAFT_948835 [Fibularhizoctonia sp. CBS 109695]